MHNLLIKTPLGIFTFSEAHQKLTEAGIPVDKDSFVRLEVETEIYQPSEKDPRYLNLVRRKTPKEIWAEVKAILHHYVPDWKDRFDYIGNSCMCKDGPIPSYNNIACYVVAGGSEGHYLHVDYTGHPDGSCVILGKTFLGPQAAWDVAIAIATILGAV